MLASASISFWPFGRKIHVQLQVHDLVMNSALDSVQHHTQEPNVLPEVNQEDGHNIDVVNGWEAVMIVDVHGMMQRIGVERDEDAYDMACLSVPIFHFDCNDLLLFHNLVFSSIANVVIVSVFHSGCLVFLASSKALSVKVSLI